MRDKLGFATSFLFAVNSYFKTELFYLADLHEPDRFATSCRLIFFRWIYVIPLVENNRELVNK